MEKSERDIIEAGVRRLLAHEYSIYLLEHGKKKHAFRSPKFVTPVELRFHLRKRLYGLGVGLGVEVVPGKLLMVADAEDADGIARLDELNIKSPMAVTTGGGGEHRYGLTTVRDARNKIKKLGVDWLFHGFASAPPNIHESGNRYVFKDDRIVKASELPVFDLPPEVTGKVPIDVTPPVGTPISDGIKATQRSIERSFVAGLPLHWKIESARLALSQRYSIAGSGGDMELFKAACLLIQWYELPFGVAYQLLREWNRNGINVVPPWPDDGGTCDRLLYKLREALRLKP